MGTAFVKILYKEMAIYSLYKFEEALKSLGFENFVLFEQSYPINKENFVIWRYNASDKISDCELVKILGNKGSVLYVWECNHCGVLCSRRAYINVK